MAIDLRSLKTTRQETGTQPPITLIYGVDGIGKSTLAAEWPDGLYLATPGETPPVDVDLPKQDIESLDVLWDVFGELINGDHDFKTVIIDTLDGVEPLLNDATCARIGAESLDSNEKGSPAAFGKGYVEADVEWLQFMAGCLALKKRGIAVVLLSHQEIKRFDSPTDDPYDRYQIKLHKRGAAIVREQSDIVAFCNYRVTLKTKDVAPQKKITHGEGGKERQIHLTESAGFHAKNRYSMPDSIVYVKGQGYTKMSQYFPAPTGVANDNQSEESEAA